METLTYDKHSQMAHNMIQTWYQYYNITSKNKTTTEGNVNLYINYQTLDTVVSQKVKILNASSFVSSVGGNLGLFIGFSFLDSLFVVCKWLCNYFNNRIK